MFYISPMRITHVTDEGALAGCLPHLTPNERQALTALVECLRQMYGDDLLRVVLYGSKARGDSDEESDLDVLVVVRLPEDAFWQHWQRIVNETAAIELGYGVVLSLLIEDEPEYTQMRQWNLLLNRNIEQDGIELWAATRSEMSFAWEQ
ncbi:MAG: nucleotidyltransferase domain-containing protein [Chloroflexota bacterium]